MSTRRSPEARRAVLLLAVAAASAWPVDDPALQRQRIADERTRIEDQAHDARVACAAQFAAAACLSRVNVERRERLRRLDHDSAVLDGQDRKRRAAERLARVEERQAAAAVAPTPVPAPLAKARKPQAPPALGGEVDEPGSSPAPRRSPSAASAAAAQAAQRAQAAARRAWEAAAHREAVEKRLQQRSTQRAPAKPLPIPASAPR